MGAREAGEDAFGTLNVCQMPATSRPLILPACGLLTLDERSECVARKIDLAGLIDHKEVPGLVVPRVRNTP